MQNKETINVLIPSIGCNTSISVAKALRLSRLYKYKIVGTDMKEACEACGSIFCDKHYITPPTNDKRFIKRLLQICKKENIQVLLPIMDQDTEKVSQFKDIFKRQGIIICSSDLKTVRSCNDKYLTYKLLKKHGIAVPDFILKRNIKDCKLNMSFPVFLKPQKGMSSIDCFKIKNKDELKVFLKTVKEPLIQELLSGQHCVIDVVNDLSSKNLISIPRHEYSAKAGIGVKAKIVNDKSLSHYGKQISEILKIKGVANIEVFKKNNTIHLIEVNARFSAGVILSVISGANIPEITIDVFMGKKIKMQRLSWKKDFYMSRYWQEVFSRNRKINKKIDYKR